MTFRLQRRKPKKMGVRSQPQVRCAPHLAWVRGHVCSIAGKHTCSGKSEAAHIRSLTDGGMALKPGDDWTIPLCSDAHREQHQIGELAFENKYRIGMRNLARSLAARSPHKSKWQEK